MAGCQEAFHLLVLLFGLAWSLTSSAVGAGPTGTRCPPAPGRSETCVCMTDKGVVDLTSLSRKDGSPR